MTENAFIGKLEKPTPKELATALGSAKALWDRTVGELAHDFGVTEQEWNSYSPKAGWSLRLKHKKRVIVYLGPCQGSFRVAFVLGEKALKSAEHIKLPVRIADTLHEAKHYPEGYAVRFEVRALADIDAVKKIALAKLEN